MSIPINPPLIYERLIRAQAAGCIAYLLIIPMFCGIAAIAGGALG